MKNLSHHTFIMALLLTLGMSFTACNIEDIPNPNGPTLETITQGPTAEDLRLLATGTEHALRFEIEFYFQTVSIVGREYWDLNATDPRYTGELLGAQGAQLDNNGFLTTRSYSARYRGVKNANVLLEALANNEAGLTDQEENGISAIAKTFKAYSLLLVLNRQFQNGARLDVANPEALGPFVSYSEGLAGVQALLNEAAGELNNAGNAFAVNLSIGFENFNTPATFLQFNRAIAARVALYQEDYDTALALLDESFFDIAGDLAVGPGHAFGTAGTDTRNPLFYALGQQLYIAHPDFLADAETGDSRVAQKTTLLIDDDTMLPDTISVDGLEGSTQVTIYASPSSIVPIIRNEELILIYAEAQMEANNPSEAVAAIDAVRTGAGLAGYGGETTKEALITEILHQRRYSLFGEGHRWLDLRRRNLISEINIDREGDIVHTQFPTPIAENR